MFRFSIFVIFECADSHGREECAGLVFYLLILLIGDGDPRKELFEAKVFLYVCFIPDIFVLGWKIVVFGKSGNSVGQKFGGIDVFNIV